MSGTYRVQLKCFLSKWTQMNVDYSWKEVPESSSLSCSSILFSPSLSSEPAIFKSRIQKSLLRPDWCGSVGWVLSHEPKGLWFYSQSGHMPGLQFVPVGGEREATNQSFTRGLWMFLSLSSSLLLFLKIKIKSLKNPPQKSLSPHWNLLWLWFNQKQSKVPECDRGK